MSPMLNNERASSYYTMKEKIENALEDLLGSAHKKEITKKKPLLSTSTKSRFSADRIGKI